MDAAILVRIIILIVLFALSAFFSSAESAFFTLGSLRAAKLKGASEKTSRLIARLLEQPRRLIITIISGNELVNVAIGIAFAGVFWEIYGPKGGYWAIPLSAGLLLIFGEMLPKTLAVRNPEFFCRNLAVPLEFVTKISLPVRWGLRKIVDFVLPTSDGQPEKSVPLITEEDFKTLVDIGTHHGVIELGEREMIRKVFEFGDTVASEVMTPRTDIFALNVDQSLADAMEQIKAQRFSRIPIYEGTIDSIVGVIYAKDLLKFRKSPPPALKLKQICHPPYFVPATKNVADLLREFLRQKIHLAIVVDEYGGVAGLVTLEDLLEEIVGEIADEFDVKQESIKRLDENTYRVSAMMAVQDLGEAMGVNLPEGDYDTVGGLVLSLFGRLPKNGESVQVDGLTFTVDKMKGVRLVDLKVKKMS